jgi:hypothetical protein
MTLPLDSAETPKAIYTVQQYAEILHYHLLNFHALPFFCGLSVLRSILCIIHGCLCGVIILLLRSNVSTLCV